MWFEPTSVAKSSKIADSELLSLLTYISPNVHEVVAITNILQPSLKDKKGVGLRERVKVLLSYGVKHVILKRGEKGVLLGTTLKCPDCTSTERAADGSDIFYFKEYEALPVLEVVNVTGAGDSMVGACIWSLLRGNSISKSIHFGLIAAKLSVESKYAVSEHLSEELMLNSEPAVDIATFSSY